MKAYLIRAMEDEEKFRVVVKVWSEDSVEVEFQSPAITEGHFRSLKLGYMPDLSDKEEE